MPRPSELERGVERIDELIQRLETAADPALRATAQELVQSLLSLHGAGLERIVALAGENGHGPPLLERFTQDALVRSLLLLHGLHPVALETRVRDALDQTRPYLRSHGGNVELAGIEADGTVRLRLQGSCHGCPSSAMTLKLAIEQAIHEAAPDVTAIVVEGDGPPPQPASPAPVALRSANRDEPGNAAGAVWQAAPDLSGLAAGRVHVLPVAGRDVLFCRLDETFYAYGDRCPGCGRNLAEADLSGRVLSCRGCRQSYDMVRAGRGLDRPELHLEPFPLLLEHGRAKVALPPMPVALESR